MDNLRLCESTYTYPGGFCTYITAYNGANDFSPTAAASHDTSHGNYIVSTIESSIGTLEGC